MKKIIFCSLLLSFLLLNACQNTPGTPKNWNERPWCLMFYMEGGERDYFEQAYINQAAAACADSTARGWQEKTAMTVLYRPSPSWQHKPEWKGTHRFYAQKGKLVKDTVFQGEFIPSNDTTLADYIRWAKAKYPDHRYMLVLVGHGAGWYPKSEPPYSIEHLHDTTQPWHPFVTTAQIRNATRMSGGRLDMIYFNMCMMNQVESLAEWTEAARYIMATNNPTPDVGSNYNLLVRTLQQRGSFESNLIAFLDYQFGYWKEFEEACAMDITLTDMDAFPAILPAWKAITSQIMASLDDTVRATDPPAVFKSLYKPSYIQAFRDSWTRFGFSFGVDMRDYAYKAFSHTGNMALPPLIHQLDLAISQAIVYHNQTFEGNTLSYVITSPIRLWDYEEHKETYRQLEFNRQTGWDLWLETAYKECKNESETKLKVVNKVQGNNIMDENFNTKTGCVSSK